MRRRFPGAPKVAPPPGVRAAADCILALPHGARDDLRDVALDMSAAPPFERRAYECVRAIAPGATLIYGEVAARLGEPGAGRAVGQALGRNPFVAVVP